MINRIKLRALFTVSVGVIALGAIGVSIWLERRDLTQTHFATPDLPANLTVGADAGTLLYGDLEAISAAEGYRLFSESLQKEERLTEVMIISQNSRDGLLGRDIKYIHTTVSGEKCFRIERYISPDVTAAGAPNSKKGVTRHWRYFMTQQETWVDGQFALIRAPDSSSHIQAKLIKNRGDVDHVGLSDVGTFTKQKISINENAFLRVRLRYSRATKKAAHALLVSTVAAAHRDKDPQDGETLFTQPTQFVDVEGREIIINLANGLPVRDAVYDAGGALLFERRNDSVEMLIDVSPDFFVPPKDKPKLFPKTELEYNSLKRRAYRLVPEHLTSSPHDEVKTTETKKRI